MLNQDIQIINFNEIFHINCISIKLFDYLNNGPDLTLTLTFYFVQFTNAQLIRPLLK